MIAVMRVDACPYCLRGFPDRPKVGAGVDDAADCPVCLSRPVRVLVLRNSDVNRAGAVAASTRHEVAGHAALLAADVLKREDDACGPVLPVRQVAGPDVDALRERARKAGAEPQLVTPDGYTQLPACVVDELCPGGGCSGRCERRMENRVVKGAGKAKTKALQRCRLAVEVA